MDQVMVRTETYFKCNADEAEFWVEKSFFSRILLPAQGRQGQETPREAVAIINTKGGLLQGGVSGGGGKRSYSGYILRAELKIFSDGRKDVSCRRKRRASAENKAISLSIKMNQVMGKPARGCFGAKYQELSFSYAMSMDRKASENIIVQLRMKNFGWEKTRHKWEKKENILNAANNWGRRMK